MGVVVAIDGGKEPKASVKPLVDLTRDDMALVNQLILSKTGSQVTMLPEVAQHLIDSGGKRLRPMLTLAAARMCGYRGDHHVTLAASVEFMHTATLLQNDINQAAAVIPKLVEKGVISYKAFMAYAKRGMKLEDDELLHLMEVISANRAILAAHAENDHRSIFGL